MAEARTSLARRLLAMLVGGTAVAWIAIAVATYVDARVHAQGIFDAQLAEYAEVLAAIAGHEAYEVAGETTSLAGGGHGATATYQVFAASGELLLRSHAAPLEPMSRVDGYADVEEGGVRRRVFRYTDRVNHLVVVAAHRQDDREALVEDLALRLLVPLVLALPLATLGIWLAVRRAVAPLEGLAREVGGRRAGDLAPVDASRAPREVQPLAHALNRLFARLAESFENERRFTGDAAHELRTPLAALRTQAEVALTTAHDERRRRALEQVVAGVDRATGLVDQMLALARLDASEPTLGATLDLAALVRETVDECAPLAQGARRAIDIEQAGALTVQGDAAMLHALLRNVVENALRHAKARVRVILRHEGDEAMLAIEDDGPGVPPALRARIFDRFFRAPDAGPGGSGLGLSIARRVAELHHGTIAAVEGALGGLRVEVRLPAAR